MRARSFVWLLAASSLGCSWSRYDDIVESSPIVLLNRPKELSSGFGSSLATATVDDQVTLLVGGSPLQSGGAEFQLGRGDHPTLEARDTGHCLGSDAPCYFSSTPVALARAKGPSKDPEPLCFADGAGTASQDTGIVVRCVDDVEYALDIPEVVQSLLRFSIDNAQPTEFRFGADHGPDPALVASADQETAVWYYPPLSRDFVSLFNPLDSKGKWPKTARTLAVARIGTDAKLVAVGAPDEGTVRLFSAPDGAAPAYVGCLGGSSKFGRAFATGPIADDDGNHDALVISDSSIVYVFDAVQLATLTPTTNPDCSLGSLPKGTLITSFTCGSTKNISGCDSSEFGVSLGVGDLDGDGDGEVVVGAPSMTVRHQSRAGAVLIYDAEEPAKGKPGSIYDLKDIAFLSSADVDDQLGRSLALPSLGDRQLLVAGAPGGGKAALFYCPSFLPDSLAGSRCK